MCNKYKLKILVLPSILINIRSLLNYQRNELLILN
jgi:hypothetical protein